MSDFDLYESEIEELYRPKEEPKVWLTIEEAKKLFNTFIVLCNNKENGKPFFTPMDGMKFMSNKIEQAEKGCEHR